MKNDEFGYALHDIRIGLEKGVKCIIIHWKGDSYIKEKLDDNITVCKSYALLPRDFVEELYDAKPLQSITARHGGSKGLWASPFHVQSFGRIKRQK